MWREVHLVDNEQVGARDGRTAFAWDLFALTDADDVEGDVGELRGEGCGWG